MKESSIIKKSFNKDFLRREKFLFHTNIFLNLSLDAYVLYINTSMVVYVTPSPSINQYIFNFSSNLR